MLQKYKKFQYHVTFVSKIYMKKLNTNHPIGVS